MRKLLFILLIFNCSAYAQTASLIQTKDANSIKTESLKAFVQNFEKIECPFSFSEINEENPIDFDLMNQMLHLDIEQEEFGLDEYYYGYAFFEKDFFGLLITHHYIPGIMGIDNYFIQLYTISYDGEVIASEDLGCFCTDTNMGSNDYTSTEVKISIDSKRIYVHETFRHATLIEDGEEEPFEEISHSKHFFHINPAGEVKRINESNN